ncbi:MAG: 4'-phosphopantetheinyl transferase superfamily protein [Candidatus Cardinium sp.]|uniref:4'-phosphopantetheinyl transferase family protein n=1 Tax=Cardinium endosymbiont of Dermatophagoides farinae TaxID=2597823 RepID=UPI001183DA5C|nr:4'-phosphopantetheinyl transferase family protein [Cardinium endosymbiont of Dermatophagoides farinae]TSJ81342.1 4'-phosphopantetheinyl transferase superfamily protein [Cardinium endosymbiont of Dermatophagoides farinae]UWW97405.1 MAG: 4'-phosphopantetheinyl transferase superfamily protein [Candidatus Cardinium sp.]
MSFYSFSAYTATSFLLIWKIEESVATLRSQLPPQFLVDYHSSNLSSTDRIRQSLAVRVALYHLLQKLALPILVLSKNGQGQPILGDGRFHISFTHTRYVAAVALSTVVPIGVDIEMVTPTLRRVQERFLTNKEVQNANHCLEQLAIYWAAKEALYKRLANQKITTFKAIFIAPFVLQGKGKVIAHFNGRKYGMDYQQIADSALPPHVLVCCAD